MSVSRHVESLKAAAIGESSLECFAPLGADALAAIERAPAPGHGVVLWKLPPSYRRLLGEVGRFCLGWYSPALDSKRWIELLDAGGIRTVSEVVYLPEGVDRGDGRALSTHHLVPFAGPPGGDGEWAFCFDVSGPGPEYPVFYHHQDEARARYAATGEWDDATPSTPDFASFEAWLAWLADALEKGTDPEPLGQPTGHLALVRPESRP